MKVGIIGAGAVGSASLLSLVIRGLACEIVVVDRNRQRARGVVADLQYGATLSPAVVLEAGDYPDLSDAVLVIITVGINEKAGGATDRSDPAGRLKLLKANAASKGPAPVSWVSAWRRHGSSKPCCAMSIW
jgi:L-lactate dehydrogenase